MSDLPTTPVGRRFGAAPPSPGRASSAATPLDQRPFRPRPASAGARVGSDGASKHEFACRVRPGSAHASSRKAGAGGPTGAPPQGGWNLRTGCEDLSLRLLDVDREQAWKGPSGSAGPTATGSGGPALSGARTLSHRKPALPGAVCYGTNTRQVPLPRRPTTTDGGRENRPPPAAPSTTYGRAALGAGGHEAAVATAPAYEAALARGDFGGWEPSTLVSDGAEPRHRYPPRYAQNDVTKVGALPHVRRPVRDDATATSAAFLFQR